MPTADTATTTTGASAPSLSSSLLPCNHCNVGHHTQELHRAHMRSDWHRYNIKRRLVNLAPVTHDHYKELAARALNASASEKHYKRTCGPCRKSFRSDNTYLNHIESAAHRAAEKEELEGTAGLTEAVKKVTISPEFDPDTDDIPLSVCVFCNFESDSNESNLEHMERQHSLAIPARAYLVDIDGLLQYLAEVVFLHRSCLACERTRTSFFAIQAHMKDAGHSIIPYHTLEEQLAIGDFYDFSATYETTADEDDLPVDPRIHSRFYQPFYHDGTQLYLADKSVNHRAVARPSRSAAANSGGTDSSGPRAKARRDPGPIGRHNRGVTGLSEHQQRAVEKNGYRAIERGHQRVSQRLLKTGMGINRALVRPADTSGG